MSKKLVFTGTKDTDQLVLANVDITAVANLLDIVDEKVIEKALPIIIKKHNGKRNYLRDMEELIYDLIIKDRPELIKTIFTYDPNLVSYIINGYVTDDEMETAVGLVKIIPNNFDWYKYDLTGNFEDEDYQVVKEQLLLCLELVTKSNSLSLLNIILKTYDREVTDDNRIKLENLEEMKKARLRNNIYVLSKSWDNVKDFYNNETVKEMNSMINKIEKINDEKL